MKTQINHLVALTLCAISLVNSLPTAEEYPEVIPGPGLPSLASLNLTSAELYQRVPSLDVTKKLERRFPLQCNQVPQCSDSEATACFNYLNALGHQACTVPGPYLDGKAVFCSSGPCNWIGENFDTSGNTVSSYCSDVATGGSDIIFSCSQTNGLVSGSNAANGNGNLVITISTEIL